MSDNVVRPPNVVHIRHADKVLCGMPPGNPDTWPKPNRHGWVGLALWTYATCPGCRRVGQLLQDIQDKNPGKDIRVTVGPREPKQ